MDNPTDNELIERMRDGDTSALGILYIRYSSAVKGFASKFIEIQNEVDDLNHNIFINLWENRDKIRDVSSSNDIVFMYVGAPISAIIYQCQVLEVNLPYHEQNKFLTITHVMRIKKLLSYPSDAYTYKKLADYNVKAIRGPRHVPQSLLKDLLKKRK